MGDVNISLFDNAPITFTTYISCCQSHGYECLITQATHFSHDECNSPFDHTLANHGSHLEPAFLKVVSRTIILYFSRQFHSHVLYHQQQPVYPHCRMKASCTDLQISRSCANCSHFIAANCLILCVHLTSRCPLPHLPSPFEREADFPRHHSHNKW